MPSRNKRKRPSDAPPSKRRRTAAEPSSDPTAEEVQAQPAAQDVDNPQETTESNVEIQVPQVDRQVRVRGLLKHRKLLLEQLQRAKSVAKQRLDVIYRDNPQQKEQSYDQEIQTFREVLREATSIARKQSRADNAAHEQPRERTSNLSLRRGASVGKKMQSALSPLSSSQPHIAAR